MTLSGALGQESLRRLLAGPEPIVERLRDPEAQLQPNGIDFTVEAVWRLASRGSVGPGRERRLPERVVVDPLDGCYRLAAGPYGVALHEILNMPRDVIALFMPRSTLLRCGVRLGSAWTDAGYHGQPEALLVVENPAGFDLAVESPICQAAFFSLNEIVPGYDGAYQGKFFT